MKKVFIILLALSFVLMGFTACSPDGVNGDSEPSPEEESQDIKDYSNGTPWLMIDLDGVVTQDTPADVKDNFALYANKDEILSRELKKDEAIVGTMYDVIVAGEKEELQMYAGDEPESHDAKLAYDLFNLMIDWDSRNEVGVEPLK